ncbi:hypothetical protein HOLleu_06958 [Holothuria leucospilota]|uniref:Uncharacterized protein n=1 Tax=Holothuria leucospilota TaxID=206669 RepID=A0A9Q1CM60_HOLLE|nr:hypothetical protein HOLleu_06958 [Holothuria leucospilota]
MPHKDRLKRLNEAKNVAASAKSRKLEAFFKRPGSNSTPSDSQPAAAANPSSDEQSTVEPTASSNPPAPAAAANPSSDNHSDSTGPLLPLPQPVA